MWQTLSHKSLRSLLSPKLNASNLVFPVFLKNSAKSLHKPESLSSRNPFESLNPASPEFIHYIQSLHNRGLKHLMLFGIPSSKDPQGSSADDDQNPVVAGLRNIRKNQDLNSLSLWADVCMCEYTSSGHCGVVDESCIGTCSNVINNNQTVDRLTEIALVYAKNGADVVCPSDMSDRRIKSIKTGLNQAGYESKTQICAYSSKKASIMYAPFRNAVESEFKGTREGYQQPVASSKTAIRAFNRDFNEGADMLLIKPALFYGDLIKEAKNSFGDTRVIVSYIVSGEHVMLDQYAKNISQGEDIKYQESIKAKVFGEAHMSCLRAGSDVIISYATPWILENNLIDLWNSYL
jgi:porphobilinogen synthase